MMMSPQTVLPTTSATSSSKKNNLVAATEYRAALSGIENRFHEISVELKERHGLESGTLFEKTQQSLIKHLDRIVQPIHNDNDNDNEDYNDYNELLRRNDDDEEQEEDEEDLEEELDEEDVEQDDEEEDLEELIDDDAVQRVTKLRDEIRKASEQLAKYRDSVTMKAMELADKEIRTTSTTAFGEMVLDLVELRENFATTKTNDNNDNTTLKQNLTQLTNDLMTMEFETTVQTLQETIDTVDNDYQQQHDDDQQPLSQTERAIRSRTNDGTSSHETTKVSVDPVERLASFLG
jgi:hypothetical protein